ncbi:hypothetical protein pEaSNUABM30_00118 [Erwinia phage pEa_SNUABM_30]|uniref:Uncharacterized protein n=1 Tax=Erwinia phage pEa_SNUABM_30 TaxID=2869553 RepID=A0AAE9BSH2_9CAUD|nr:hypothetical protein MPK69_gp118 [Erwinia phage pEa_SNUABM_30]UAW53236.1 hypothetical protein pEaSNUABM30_00118 [Erwinia phage pEa_SNUABM_30]
MLSLSQAWGTKFFPTAVEPEALTTLIFASAMNLTGARSLSESAVEQNCHRAAQVARPFAEAAEFIQRVYNKHPDYQIVVLGQGGMASHCVVADAEGQIVFDTFESCRLQYFPGCMYSYSLGAAGSNEVSVQARATLFDAYRTLQDQGLWKDNAGSWDVDLPRGLDSL